MTHDAPPAQPLKLTVLASIPAALAGALNLGEHIARIGAGAEGVWQLEWLAGLGLADRAPSVVIGLLFLAPLLAVAAAISRLAAEAFARARGRPLDRGWFYHAWLFVLLSPATLPLPYAALGMAFGVLFGCHVFGGTGRYVASPALLGVLFTALAYPDVVPIDGWLPGATVPTTWTALGAGALAAPSADWWPVFLGREIGALGTTSALACLAGAAYLTARGVVPWRIVAGALLGLALASALGGSLAWHWHLALGSFAFALAFVAPDPSVHPTTRAGGFAFGALFGVLTVTLRSADPDRPEATLSALLLAMLCVPLLDWLALAARRKPTAVRSDG